ncbi:MAG TPA: hypothetical protein G4N96_06975 [Chloroflexi bacterium]|nr:hypothetical protein [Chloroflexota bacterium]
MSHTITLKLIPCKNCFAPGPGWAALGGFLASGILRFEADFFTLNAPWLLKFGLLWLLVDPVLGTLWHLVVEQGVWRNLTRLPAAQTWAVKPLLPYAAKGSVACRLSALIALLRQQKDGEWQTSLLLPLVALGLATTLGEQVVLYTLIAILSIFWMGSASPAKISLLKPFWQSVTGFLLPYIIGLNLMGGLEQNALLPGLGYWVAVFGSLLLAAGRSSAAKVVIIGQASIALLLFALIKPIAAASAGLASGFSFLLWLNAKQAQPQTPSNTPILPTGEETASRPPLVKKPLRVLHSPTPHLSRQISPILLLSFLIAALSLGGVR